MVELAERLAELGWVTDLWVAGSLATGDYRPGVSDLDLVAVTDGAIDADRTAALVGLHEALDARVAAGDDLGCVYVPADALTETGALHPTWTHGRLVQRVLSGITRSELVRAGIAVSGRPPASVLQAMSEDDVRRAARAELCGYWRWAGRRPWLWLDPVMADLGLTSMARARHTVLTGELLSRADAIDDIQPSWLREQVRWRRFGGELRSPRLRTAWLTWRDVRQTCDSLCSEPSR